MYKKMHIVDQYNLVKTGMLVLLEYDLCFFIINVCTSSILGYAKFDSISNLVGYFEPISKPCYMILNQIKELFV